MDEKERATVMTYQLAVVMDDIDTLLSGFTLCLAYLNFPSSTFTYLPFLCLHIFQRRRSYLRM